MEECGNKRAGNKMNIRSEGFAPWFHVMDSAITWFCRRNSSERHTGSVDAWACAPQFRFTSSANGSLASAAFVLKLRSKVEKKR